MFARLLHKRTLQNPPLTALEEVVQRPDKALAYFEEDDNDTVIYEVGQIYWMLLLLLMVLLLQFFLQEACQWRFLVHRIQLPEWQIRWCN